MVAIRHNCGCARRLKVRWTNQSWRPVIESVRRTEFPDGADRNGSASYVSRGRALNFFRRSAVSARGTSRSGAWISFSVLGGMKPTLQL